MKKGFLRITASIMVIIFLSSYSLPSFAANITVPTQDIYNLFVEAFEAGNTAKELEAFFNNEIQFNTQDFQSSNYNEEWINDARTFIENTIASSPAVLSDTVSEESHAKATSMTYALECAAWSLNKGRGTNFSDEATYMFISHYIDRPEYYWSNNNNAFLLDGPTLSEDSQYYAKWITDDDRAAYRIYMNNGKISTVFETVRTVYSGCQTLIGNTNILRNITMDINSMKKTLNLAKVTYITYDNIMALQDSRESVKTVYTALKSSPTKLSVLYEQLIEDDNIFRNADQTIRNQLISNTLSMFGGFLLGGVIGVLDSLRSGLLNCVIDYYIDLIDLAAYASMRYSFHGRLANRTYDYIMDNYM